MKIDGQEFKVLGKDFFGTGIFRIDLITIDKEKYVVVACGDDKDEMKSRLMLLSFPGLDIVNDEFALCPKQVSSLKVSNDQ